MYVRIIGLLLNFIQFCIDRSSTSKGNSGESSSLYINSELPCQDPEAENYELVYRNSPISSATYSRVVGLCKCRCHKIENITCEPVDQSLSSAAEKCCIDCVNPMFCSLDEDDAQPIKYICKRTRSGSNQCSSRRRPPIQVQPIEITSNPLMCDCECHLQTSKKLKQSCELCDCKNVVIMKR